MLNTDLIVGAPAAAEFTGLTARRIYHLVDIGELPAIKKGKCLFFRKSELEAAFRSETA